MTTETLVGHRHEQTSGSTAWTIQHNLGTEAPIVDVWIDISGTIHKVMPASVVVTDANNVTINFSSAQTGVALIA